MSVYVVPPEALDAAEKVWYDRLNMGLVSPPREHIEQLLRAAAPYISPAVVEGEVISSQTVGVSESKPQTVDDL